MPVKVPKDIELPKVLPTIKREEKEPTKTADWDKQQEQPVKKSINPFAKKEQVVPAPAELGPDATYHISSIP